MPEKVTLSVYISNNGNLLFFVLPAIISLISLVILFIIKCMTFRVIRRWADTLETETYDSIIGAVRTPSVYWIIAISLYIGIEVSEIPPKYIFYLTRAVYIIVVISVSYAAADLSERFLRNYSRKPETSVPSSGLATTLVKWTIILIGVLTALEVLGVSIIPLITALGVGGLAVALALKDTLTNLFAGIHIMVEKSVRVGDFIKLETGQEGYVEDITWRTTRIKMLPNNILIVPNNNLSQSVVTNYSLPDKETAISLQFSVSYGADPERVEYLIVETARSAADEITGLLCEPLPIVRFVPGFGENSMDFTLKCQIREIADRGQVTHELRRRILAELRNDGIEIPFPQRVLHVRK